MTALRTWANQPDVNLAATTPGGYRITHVFQYQDDDEETNTGQYTESVTVETWEDITNVVDNMLIHTDGMGFTVSIDIRAVNQEEPS